MLFCSVCVSALKSKKMGKSRGDLAFTVKGFSNWKDGTIGIKKHEVSGSHKGALQVMVVIPSTCRGVGDMLVKQHKQEKKDNRQCLLKILSNVLFLARQGLPFRGDGEEIDSNFIQLLKLRGLDDPRIDSWLSKQNSKYTSHIIQNEILKAMYLNIIRKIASQIQESDFFCIMCDEYCDVSNKEQLVVCIRWVDSKLQAHEEFIGMYVLSDIKSNTIVAVIKDTLTRLNLSLKKCRGQCYDGASNMTGSRNGVATQICEEEPKALF